MSGDPHVAFVGASKRFAEGAQALADVTFHVPRGQFCALVGPSGSGKSTLLRAVNGLTQLSGGEVRVDGVRVDAASLPRIRRKVGMVHQDFGLVSRASVAENMIAGAIAEIPTWRALLGLYPAAHQAKACALLAEVGLAPEHLPRRVSELSGGQRQRVGIARALMLDPEVLVADEPVASLDPRASEEVLDLMRREALARGVTVLCSLHQLDLARRFADRIVALRAGRLMFDGPTDAFDAATEMAIYGPVKESAQ
ncbi:phosphonate ABC transporter ATP-binding protein [Phenylobacterium kunshanense]|uniref:phosphonate ABC transporter ATP-binding protein n=1 Tax=Phenylobacterium kunshanense TaxID=1445034 RepID=UPI00197BB77C|nr:phosphonate ABC transporter ATP-binding protein [Phenylobacterium kunshanense]